MAYNYAITISSAKWWIDNREVWEAYNNVSYLIGTLLKEIEEKGLKEEFREPEKVIKAENEENNFVRVCVLEKEKQVFIRILKGLEEGEIIRGFEKVEEKIIKKLENEEELVATLKDILVAGYSIKATNPDEIDYLIDLLENIVKYLLK